MIGFSLISNPSELGPIRTLAKRDRLFNPQVFHVELVSFCFDKRRYFRFIQQDINDRLTEILVGRVSVGEAQN